MRAFIVRPFGTHEGINFDRVERELIDPVLTSLGVEGRTTGEIARAGNIRTDMFEGLLLADIVVADISIHTANVYYELGIRHALRDRITILIRARAAEVPFDLKTDLYLEYDKDEPAAARPLLTGAAQESFAARRADSPVSLLLPGFEPRDPNRLHPVPAGFTEDVRRARRKGDRPMLAVLGDEAEWFEWHVAGSRVVGRAQFEMDAWREARATWSSVQRELPDDVEANLRLGTIFQRLGKPAASFAVLERVLRDRAIAPSLRAEALALKGSNSKTCWIAEWSDAPANERAAAALRSPFLDEARTAYDEGFLTDQNQWCSGVNALGLTIVTVLLAERARDAWEERFEGEEDVRRASRRLDRARAALAAAVRRSLDGAELRRAREGLDCDVWLEFTRAELLLLTSDKPGVVARGYREVQACLAERGDPDASFFAESAAQQIRTYRELGVLTANVQAALHELGVPEERPSRSEAPRTRVLVFSGHRIDAPGRAAPRFPPRLEPRAADIVRDAVWTEMEFAGDGPVEGVAAGASGGDILFHEACAGLGVPTTLRLALPPAPFAAASVAVAGAKWTERFHRLCDRLAVNVLSDTPELPDWLAPRPDYSIWERANRWLLHIALSREDADVTLVVLWDGNGGDGAGGTQDMVDLARSLGIKIVHLDTARLGAASPSVPSTAPLPDTPGSGYRRR